MKKNTLKTNKTNKTNKINKINQEVLVPKKTKEEQEREFKAAFKKVYDKKIGDKKLFGKIEIIFG